MVEQDKKQIEENKSKLGEITNKITVHFSKNGVGVDTSETGASRPQVLQAIFALCSILDRDDFTTGINMIEDVHKTKELLGALKEAVKTTIKEKIEKENKDGVQE